MRKFHDLIVWKKAHELVLDVYRITEHFPAEERAGLSSQMRRAAMMVPATIVEGHSSGKFQDFIHAMMATESVLTRLQYYIELSRELGYLYHDQMVLLLENLETINQLICGVRVKMNQEPSHAHPAIS